MTELTYRVHVEGGGLTLDRDVSKEVGERIVVLVLYGLGQMPAPVNRAPGAPVEGLPPDVSGLSDGFVQNERAEEVSLSEFLATHNATKNPEKITAIAYYLRVYRKQPSFTKPDLPALFDDADEKVPTNLSRDLATTKAKGWITTKVGEPDSYRIAKDGLSAVDSNFAAEAGRKPPARASDRRRNEKRRELGTDTRPVAPSEGPEE